MSAQGLGLVVPVFEEAERLREFGDALADFIHEQPDGSELVFVDDGSSDATMAMLEDLRAHRHDERIRVIARPHEGKGAAVAAGLRSISQPYAAFCDVDLSTPLEDLGRIIAAARRADLLAIGSRDLATSTLVRPQGPIRRNLGRAYNRLVQATVAPGIVDTQCGAKAAATSVWAELLPYCRQQGFAWDAELIAVAQALRIDIQEVPIAWHHDDRSKVRVLRDGTAMVVSTRRIWRSARTAAAVADARPRPAVAASATGDRPGEVFDEARAAELMGSDRTHWWFRSKAALVATALARTVHDAGGGWLVDVGGGGGGVTALLGWAPNQTLVAEGSPSLVHRAHHTLGLGGVNAAVDALPVASGSAAVVSLLDVIEHLADPSPALAEAARVLGPGGRLVINVPAHGWLWSKADEVLGHHRRYNRRRLRRELEASGFEPVLLSHVFSWLVPFVWLTRRVRGRNDAELGLDRRSPAIDLASLTLTAGERTLLGRVTLPLGTSIVCVARPQTGTP